MPRWLLGHEGQARGPWGLCLADIHSPGHPDIKEITYHLCLSGQRCWQWPSVTQGREQTATPCVCQEQTGPLSVRLHLCVRDLRAATVLVTTAPASKPCLWRRVTTSPQATPSQTYLHVICTHAPGRFLASGAVTAQFFPDLRSALLYVFIHHPLCHPLCACWVI